MKRSFLILSIVAVVLFSGPGTRAAPAADAADIEAPDADPLFRLVVPFQLARYSRGWRCGIVLIRVSNLSRK
jgi:hypothetical protein